MKKFRILAMLAVSATLVCCQKDTIFETSAPAALPSGEGIREITLSSDHSRVGIADDGLTVTWKAGDELLLKHYDPTTGAFDEQGSQVFTLATGAQTKLATFATEGAGILPGHKYLLIHTRNKGQVGYVDDVNVKATLAGNVQASATDYSHLENNIVYATSLLDGSNVDYASFAPCQSILELRLSLAQPYASTLKSVKVTGPETWFVTSYTYKAATDKSKLTASMGTSSSQTLTFAEQPQISADPDSPLVVRMLVWWNSNRKTITGNATVTLTMEDGATVDVPFLPSQVWTAGAKYKKTLSGIQFGAPQVTTGTVASAATFKYNVVVYGSQIVAGDPVLEAGVCFSKTNATPTLADSKVTQGKLTGMMDDVKVEILKPGTKYYLRAYATNANGTGYGDVIEVTTRTEYLEVLANGGVSADFTDSYRFNVLQTYYYDGTIPGGTTVRTRTAGQSEWQLEQYAALDVAFGDLSRGFDLNQIRFTSNTERTEPPLAAGEEKYAILYFNYYNPADGKTNSVQLGFKYAINEDNGLFTFSEPNKTLSNYTWFTAKASGKAWMDNCIAYMTGYSFMLERETAAGTVSYHLIPTDDRDKYFKFSSAKATQAYIAPW